MKAKYIGLVIMAVFAIVGFVSFVRSISGSETYRSGEGLWWNEYAATVDGWYIDINESQDVGRMPERIVRITKVGDEFTGITGHGDPLTGEWYRIFWISHNPDGSITGYNSYELEGSKWIWSPCPGDKNMKPISESEIPKAITTLNEAMKQRIISNIRIVWTYHSTTDLSKLREKSKLAMVDR